jgi:hypothetical protein
MKKTNSRSTIEQEISASIRWYYVTWFIVFVTSMAIAIKWFGWIFGVIGGAVFGYFAAIMIASLYEMFWIVVILIGIGYSIKVFLL